MPQISGNIQKAKSSRRKFFVIGCLILLYPLSYIVDSFCGGYWMIPEMDGRDTWSFGLPLMDAFLWQPRFGREAIGDYDFVGAFYKPLIRMDRKFIHPTIYLDDDGWNVLTHLPVSKVHPVWRDDYVSDFEVTASCNKDQKVISCKLRLTGSAYPHVLTKIWITRDLALALQASPPTGFIEKSFGDYQKVYKEEYIQWVGRISLPTNDYLVLEIPAKQPQLGNGSIRFECERKEASPVNHDKVHTVRLESKLSSKLQ